MIATVLVVDDDPNARLLVRTVLEHAGHSVVEASNGLQGLQCAAAAAPNLVLLDLSMQTMGGAEFIRTLRAQPKTRNTVVALYTATPMNPALRDFMEIYAIDCVVPKPSEPLELVSAVERALERTR